MGLRIVYMGTPDFAVLPLQRLHAAGHDIVAVYSQPPRPVGRGQAVRKSPVHECADALGLPVFNPLSFKRDAQAQADFAAHNADVAVVAAYGLILPQGVLDAPKMGCLNIHASLLPRWRGASPIQHAILSGDAQSGVTIMQMEAGLDTGPMLSKRSIDLPPDMTASALHDALSVMGAEMIVDILYTALPTGVVQDDAQSTYAPMLKKEDGRVDWNKSAVDIDRMVRALNPWPGVWCMMESGRRLKILAAMPVDGPVDGAGTVLNKSGDVACGTGALRLIRVQPENAKAMDIQAAINGGYIAVGAALD